MSKNSQISSIPNTFNNLESFGGVFETIEDMQASEPQDGVTVMVKDSNRGGVFVYDNTKAAINDGGVVFDGWVRQYTGYIDMRWFNLTNDEFPLTGTWNISDSFLNSSPIAGGNIEWVYTSSGWETFGVIES